MGQVEIHTKEMLHGVDYTRQSLCGHEFDNCTFAECNLSGADLRTAIGYAVNPIDNRVVRARFSELNLAGLVGAFGVVVE
jgi:uncharacterized protein YjbI with pentapeptide repeats